MSELALEWNPTEERLESLRLLVAELRREVSGLRDENSQLHRQIFELRREVGFRKNLHARAVERQGKLKAELTETQAEVRQLKDERFGKKSEKQSSSDRTNDLEDPQANPSPKKKRGQQPDRPRPQRRDYSHLPVREQVVDVPEAARVCGCCGLPLEGLGQTDDCEQIEIETIVYRQVIRRQRYRRTCDCPDQPRTVTAPVPPKLLSKSIYGTSLWTHLLLEKFHLQRPMHRVIEQLSLLGLPLAPGTIVDGLKRIEPLLTPIYDAIRARQRESSHWHADETRWCVFVEKAGKMGHRWWLWLFTSQDTVVYVLDPSRSHRVPESHFAKATHGVLIVDRYSAYKAMSQVKDGLLRLAFCWAHVRRDFVRVGKGFPELTPWALGWLLRIRELYRLHRERLPHTSDTAEYTRADSALRDHLRAMVAQRETELADEKLRAPCRKTLVSLQEHWDGLTLFVEDPQIPLDNNQAERLMRNPAVGRKNYYGSGAEWSGRLAMMLFSIFATLTLWKINPRLWLNWYLTACANSEGHSPEDATSFLPWNMSEERLAELQVGTKSRSATTENRNPDFHGNSS